MSETKEDQPKIFVYRGWLDRGKHVWSPFVIKLEARLRFARVSYTTEAGSVRTAPNGKIPYVECRGVQPESRALNGSDSVFLGDSTLIIKQLVDWGVVPDLNGDVSPSVNAQDLAIRALLEDKLYFYHTRERWVGNYYQMRDHVLSAVPYPVRVVLGLLIYRNTAKNLHGQGTGRYTDNEIISFRLEIWESINALLVRSKAMTMDSSDNQPFWVLGGKEPNEADATLFAFVVSVLICTACPESQSVVRGFPVIVEYASRIHDTYFPDYVKWD